MEHLLAAFKGFEHVVEVTLKRSAQGETSE
jgi:hypothetical protein